MSNQNTDSIMVCLSPSPSNIHVIRVASSMLNITEWQGHSIR